VKRIRYEGPHYYCTMRSFITYTLHQISGWWVQGGWDERVI